jgi:iron complex outermembrane receptor protein
VTSVAKRAEPLSDALAAIVVITAEEIRRSGATTLPEALRLAPSLQVARVDSTQYAISARGFNNAIGNKLLVLVDGRTIYTPLFFGCFLESQWNSRTRSKAISTAPKRPSTISLHRGGSSLRA